MDATWMITTFVLIDATMTNLDHQTDVRAGVPESEIVTIALVAAKYFVNNHRIALNVMHMAVTYPSRIACAILEDPPLILTPRDDAYVALRRVA